MQKLKKIFGVSMAATPTSRETVIKKNILSPKDKDAMQHKSGIIYQYRCDRVDCNQEYIGESGGTFGERYKEHLRGPPAI